MNDTPSVDEQPKRKIATQVIAKKLRYFLPDHGVSVEADSIEEAVSKANDNKKEKVGDA